MRWLAVVPCWMIAAGVRGERPCAINSRETRSRPASPM